MANGTGNGSVAPTCPTVRGQLWPDVRPNVLGPIRKANDLTSAISAIDQITYLINTLVNNSDQPEWTEIARNTQRVRIHNPEDYFQWVEVERITRVAFQNNFTKAILEWNYKPI